MNARLSTIERAVAASAGETHPLGRVLERILRSLLFQRRRFFVDLRHLFRYILLHQHVQELLLRHPYGRPRSITWKHHTAGAQVETFRQKALLASTNISFYQCVIKIRQLRRERCLRRANVLALSFVCHAGRRRRHSKTNSRDWQSLRRRGRPHSASFARRDARRRR